MLLIAASSSSNISVTLDNDKLNGSLGAIPSLIPSISSKMLSVDLISFCLKSYKSLKSFCCSKVASSTVMPRAFAISSGVAI